MAGKNTSRFCVLNAMQKINLGFHFDVEQRARSYLGWFFNFNGTAGVWRIEVRWVAIVLVAASLH